MTIHIPAEPLAGFCAEVFARVGCQSEEADRVSASLVDANLTGHDSHGVIRVSRYADWVRTGDLIPNQSIERIVDAPSIGVVDGGFGFGQTIAPMAVDIGVEKAKIAGLSAISLRNSSHIGRVGEWAERTAAAGLISIHFVNAAGSILVAPFGDSSADCRLRRSASAFHARATRPSCLISQPHSLQKARSMSQASAESRCRTTH